MDYKALCKSCGSHTLSQGSPGIWWDQHVERCRQYVRKVQEGARRVLETPKEKEEKTENFLLRKCWKNMEEKQSSIPYSGCSCSSAMEPTLVPSRMISSRSFQTSSEWDEKNLSVEHLWSFAPPSCGFLHFIPIKLGFLSQEVTIVLFKRAFTGKLSQGHKGSG